MFKLNLYIHVEPNAIQSSPKGWYYCLEYGIHRVYGSGTGVMTYNKATLMAVCAGLGRLVQNSEVRIHSENTWAMNAMNGTFRTPSALMKWAETDFRKRGGEEIANADYWRMIYQKTLSHKIIGVPVGREDHTWLASISKEHKCDKHEP